MLALALIAALRKSRAACGSIIEVPVSSTYPEAFVYSTCLFCNGQLGTNEAIEHFPVGRRLAFDGAKGRLWVVCRRCERWNLTPLEERWEAIEECERAFGATRLRVSTDHVGLARLREGTELVRIGEPQRPEMAAWRYGDQFGRRRRKQYAMLAGGVAVVGAAAISGTMLGIVGVGAIGPATNLFNAARSIYKHRTRVSVPMPNGTTVPIRLAELTKSRLSLDYLELVLTIPAVAARRGPWWRFESGREEVEVRGDAAIRSAAALLPRLNPSGGSKADVQRAVSLLEASADPAQVFRHAAGVAVSTKRLFQPSKSGLLSALPQSTRLALEMASHEDAERRALEGELHVLEAAWRDAEEVAGIADDMFLPASVEEDLARLKRGPGSQG
jgi:hypothetical protein